MIIDDDSHYARRCLRRHASMIFAAALRHAALPFAAERLLFTFSPYAICRAYAAVTPPAAVLLYTRMPMPLLIRRRHALTSC